MLNESDKNYRAVCCYCENSNTIYIRARVSFRWNCNRKVQSASDEKNNMFLFFQISNSRTE